jgi:hypothetical protein
LRKKYDPEESEGGEEDGALGVGIIKPSDVYELMYEVLYR